MSINLGEKLNILANILSAPLYAVGGVVRNFLIDGSISNENKEKINQLKSIKNCEIEFVTMATETKQPEYSHMRWFLKEH